ncbi:hypothetical protein T492DRAFT_873725 [Pavlovales sp. CCMP2436]|nr:hypothetical protein T492DRAFT_873725 [Pavlovales sp. CCMP2436]
MAKEIAAAAGGRYHYIPKATEGTMAAVLVAARRVRVPDVELVEARQGSRRAEHSTRWFVILPDSLQQIRAEMPTLDDEWEVEKVLQYRTYYRQEQWLIKVDSTFSFSPWVDFAG